MMYTIHTIITTTIIIYKTIIELVIIHLQVVIQLHGHSTTICNDEISF